MINHVSGERIWQIVFEIAAATGYVIMPAGCPTCLVDGSMADDLPEELQDDVVIVSCGQDILNAIQAEDGRQ